MKPYLLAAVTALAFGGSAHALTYDCGQPRVHIGDVGKNPVVSSTVRHEGATWSVEHRLADGQLVHRDLQYNMMDRNAVNAGGDDKSTEFWGGLSNRNPARFMVGEIIWSNGTPHYAERLFDAGNDAVVMWSDATCTTTTLAGDPAYKPSDLTPSAPTVPNISSDDSVPITSDEDGKHLSLMVGLGSDQFQMMIDTGADILQITASVSDGLVERGEASPVFNDDGSVAKTIMGMADGHRSELRQLTIHTVTIGSHVLHDIPAIATNDDRGAMLLPGSVLGRIGKYSIDAANGKLSFGS